MRKLIYILLLIPFLTFGQKITQEGYAHLVDEKGDTISRHSTYRKALENSLHQGAGTYYVLQPKIRIEISENIPVTNLEFISISQGQITATSITILVELNSQIFDYIYVKFREEGGEWKQTDKGNVSIIHPDKLIPKTNYEYQVFAMDNGIEIKSMKLNFRTL